MYGGTRSPEQWQNEVDTYDEWGPGFVGSYLDLIASRVGKADAILVDSTNDGAPVIDEQMLNAFHGVWALWRGDYETRAELLERHARLRLKLGEAYIIRTPTGKYMVCHRKQLIWDIDKVRYIDPVTDQETFVALQGTGMIPPVWRSWKPLDSDPRRSTCDMKRALVHVREYISVKLRQDSDTVSPLVRNKIVMFDFEQGDRFKNDDDPNDPRNDMPKAYVDFLNIATKRDKKQYHEHRTSMDSVPFPMLGPDLKIVDLGRNSDPQSVELEASAINAFARSVRTPVQYIESGPGVAKFANEDFVSEAFIEDAVSPTSTAILHDIWRIVIGPLFAATLAKLTGKPVSEVLYQVRHLNLAPDLDRIRPKIDRTAKLIEGYRVGAVTRQAIADALDSPMLELPADVTEWDAWKMVAAPTLDVAQIRAVGQETVAGQQLTIPAPQAITAAPRTGQSAIFDQAARTDERLFAALTSAVQTSYARAIDDAARRLSRTATGDLKKRLAAVKTSQDKFAVLTEEDRKNIDVNDLLPDDQFVQLQHHAKTTLDRELEAFAAIALAASVVHKKPVYDTEAASVALARGVTAYTRYRLEGAPDPTAQVPIAHARDALSIAGGGEPSREGERMLPVTAAASGPKTIKQLIGKSPVYEWKHGYYGYPLNPYDDHLAADGTRVPQIDGFLNFSALTSAVGDIYPGDHPNCTCAWIMKEDHG